MATVPRTPRVVRPTPDASENETEYFGPVTRSVARGTARRVATPAPEETGTPRPRAGRRTRSRRQGGGEDDANGPNGSNGAVDAAHLAPPKVDPGRGRSISRSPSPLGLIPIHTRFRSLVHRHEVPRKVLHVSIGFLTLGLYANGFQTSSIHPVLLPLFIPIAVADFLRHKIPRLNSLYVRYLGALMRESEYHGYNGVIWYIAGAWAVLRFLPKDLGVVAVLLLSWCDPAASTVGRLWGRHTWRLRRGKSAAGSAAAILVGAATAAGFWGVAARRWGEPGGYDTGENAFAFQGVLMLPRVVSEAMGWSGKITGNVALGVMSLAAGVIASVSEAVDLFGWDDNFTIPVLCGFGLWSFLKVFGG